ncbi:MAG: hypothetical protein GY757_30210 [bacterium]|nr:hypothetical protein [bacterium]
MNRKGWTILWLVLVSLPLAAAFDLNRIGEWGTGQYTNVAISGNYAFCPAERAGMDVIDISNPARPVKVGNYDSPHDYKDFQDIYVRGNYAYAADMYGGFHVIDISIPASPSRVGHLTFPSADRYCHLHVSGNYAYMSAINGKFSIVDISTPTSPVCLSTMTTAESPREIWVKGNYAYLTEWNTGVRVIDISDPANPATTTTLALDWYAGYICIAGNYAYVTNDVDMFVIDISAPASPVIKGSCNIGSTPRGLHVVGNYAYVAATIEGMAVVDVSDPTNPAAVGVCNMPGYTGNAFAAGNYAYIAAAGGGLQIVDVSTPSSPSLTGAYDHSGRLEAIYVDNNVAYVTDDSDGLKIIDVSTPNSPQLAADESEYRLLGGLETQGSYAYLNGYNFAVLDVANPQAPQLMAEVFMGYDTHSLAIKGNYAYLLQNGEGLVVMDITTPSNPSVVTRFALKGSARDIFIRGDLAYVADGNAGLHIIDISTPTSPSSRGNCALIDATDVYVYGDYCCVIADGALKMVDVSTPSSPGVIGTYTIANCPLSGVYVNGDYAYLAASASGLFVADISNPAAPTHVTERKTPMFAHKVRGNGNLVYVTGQTAGKLYVYQVSGGHKTISGQVSSGGSGVEGVKLSFSNNAGTAYTDTSGNYSHDVPTGWSGVVTPTASDYTFRPADRTYTGVSADLAGQDYDAVIAYCTISGQVTYGGTGLEGVTMSGLPGNPVTGSDGTYSVTLEAGWSGTCTPTAADYTFSPASRTYDTVAGNYNQQDYSAERLIPVLVLNRTTLNYGATPALCTGAQQVTVGNEGNGALTWTALPSTDWITVSPGSGSGNGEIGVSVDCTGLSAGTYSGTVTVSATGATGSPAQVQVNLVLQETGNTDGPIGSFDAPADGITVDSNVALSGWALDDLQVDSVKIYRDSGDGMVFIGDTTLVEGARTDVEQGYPDYPLNYKGGWGYVMLTNFLPDGGNGTFTLYAVARDLEGQEAVLGQKTLSCDNAGAVNPFGAIDTPTPDGTVSGAAVRSSGWVLTPNPNTIPTDGSTINVYIDGVNLGHPVYNIYRPDIAELFPGYVNSSAAAAYFDFDTTNYDNGVHTVAWTATDNAGNSGSMGSHYFKIRNTGQSIAAANGQRVGCTAAFTAYIADAINQSITGTARPFENPGAGNGPVYCRTGFDETTPPRPLFPGEKGFSAVEIPPMGRLMLSLRDEGDATIPGMEFRGFMLVDGGMRPLPAGSFLDRAKGVFYWQPGPGFLGKFQLVFITARTNGPVSTKKINIRIR